MSVVISKSCSSVLLSLLLVIVILPCVVSHLYSTLFNGPKCDVNFGDVKKKTCLSAQEGISIPDKLPVHTHEGWYLPKKGRITLGARKNMLWLSDNFQGKDLQIGKSAKEIREYETN